MVLTGLTILIIGASHLTMPTSLISSLHDNLIKQGAKSVHSVGVCGSRPSSWIEPKNGTCGKAERIGTGPPKLSIMRAGKTTSIKELVEKDKPDMVIIIMGDTLGNYDKKDFDRKWANTEIDGLTREISRLNVRCAWVGPAWGAEGYSGGKTYRRVQTVSDFLTPRVKPCEYINSLEMSKPGEWVTFDGYHYLAPGYKTWADAILKSLKSLKPIK